MSMNATAAEPVLLPESDLVPLSLIALENDESVGWVAARFGDEVVVDDVGMRAISASVARGFFAERAEWQARHKAETARRIAQRQPKVRPAGVPAVEGATPYESLVTAEAGNYTTPQVELGKGLGFAGSRNPRGADR